MSHLILPITIEDVKYCPVHHAGRATRGVATNIPHPGTPPDVVPDLSNPASPWDIPLGSGHYSEISFGVTCATSVTLHVSLASANPPYAAGVDIYVNGIQDSLNYFEPGNPSDSGDIITSLTNAACGAVVTVLVYDPQFLNPGDLVVTVEITAIT